MRSVESHSDEVYVYTYVIMKKAGLTQITSASNSNKRRHDVVIIHPLALSIDPPKCLSNKISLTASSIITPPRGDKTYASRFADPPQSLLSPFPPCIAVCLPSLARTIRWHRQYSRHETYMWRLTDKNIFLADVWYNNSGFTNSTSTSDLSLKNVKSSRHKRFRFSENLTIIRYFIN